MSIGWLGPTLIRDPNSKLGATDPTGFVPVQGCRALVGENREHFQSHQVVERVSGQMRDR